MKLYVVGVGPGDPELLTLKAKKIIEASDTLFCPKGGKESLALSIVEKIVDIKDKKLVYLDFPMVKTKEKGEREKLEEIWKNLAKRVLSNLGSMSTFITLGDPSLYSTFFYLYKHLKDKVVIEFIPGVSSITASACRIQVCLGIADERIAIIPSNYGMELKEITDKFDTIVLLKPNKVFKKIQQAFATKDYETYYIKRATTEEELIVVGLDRVSDEDLDYFSTVIVKRKENGE